MGSHPTLVATLAENTTSVYTDEGLNNGQTYYYVVRAFDGTTESSDSDEASAAPVDDLAPLPPTGFTADDRASDEGGAIELGWAPSASGDVTEQRLYRGTSLGSHPTLVATFFDNTTSIYTDEGLNNGQTYYYVVRAFDGTTESSDSNEASAAPADNVPPVAPSELVAIAADQQVSLDWANNGEPDLASYSVYRATSPGAGPPDAPIATGLSASVVYP